MTTPTSYFLGNSFQNKSDAFFVYAFCNLHGIWRENLSFEQVNIVYTAPGLAGGGAATHVPSVQFDAVYITVTTAHAMTADHHISKHQLRDQEGKVIGEQNFTPSSTPMSRYSKVGITGTVTAYSFCNLHGIWKATTTVV